MPTDDTVSVRYMVDDVDEAVTFYTKLLGFELGFSAAPAFAEVRRGNLRLLLAGPASSAGRPMPDGAKPGPGGWNRIHFVVDDIEAEVAELRAAGASFRNDIVEGPGGKQILVQDPSGNVVELFWAWRGLTDIHHQGRGPGKDVHNGDRDTEEAASASVVQQGVQGRHRRAVPARRSFDRRGG